MINLFARNKHVGTEYEDGKLKIRTTTEETFFSGWVEIWVALPSLEIVSAQGGWRRALNEECYAASAVLEKVVGERISEGLTKRIDDLIGRADGCTHLTNLFLESCHAAALGFRQQRMAEALAAGLSRDDFYREWVKTRPKELLNSCVAFQEDSPVLKRITTPDGRPLGRRSPASLMGAQPGMLRFSRNKLLGVGRPQQDTFLARGILEDNAHGMVVEIEVRFPELEITAARGQMNRVPTEVCAAAANILGQRAVSMRIAPGLTATADELIGRQGCPHLNNLFLESCHAVLQATLAAHLQDARAAGLNLSRDELRQGWLEKVPLVQDKCLAYRGDSPLMARLEAAAKAGLL